MYNPNNAENLIRELAENNADLADFLSRPVIATQCIVCGHIEAPNPDPIRCPACGAIGDDVHAFPATELYN